MHPRAFFLYARPARSKTFTSGLFSTKRQRKTDRKTDRKTTAKRHRKTDRKTTAKRPQNATAKRTAKRPQNDRKTPPQNGPQNDGFQLVANLGVLRGRFAVVLRYRKTGSFCGPFCAERRVALIDAARSRQSAK